MSLLLYLAAAFLLFKLAAGAVVFSGLRAMRFRSDASAALIERGAMPPHALEELSGAEAELAALGFDYAYALRIGSHTLGRADRWSSVFFDAERVVAALASTSVMEDESDRGRIAFETLFTDGPSEVTVNGMRFALIGEIPNAALHDYCTPRLDEQLRLHRKRVTELSASRGIEPLTTAGHAERQLRAARDYVPQLVRRGWLRPAGTATYALRVRPALLVTWRVLRGMHAAVRAAKARKTWPPRPADAETRADAEVEGFLAREAARAGAKGAERRNILALSASIVLFALSFAGYVALPTLLLLIGVILLHEAGHLCAMACFRHKDLRMLFIPFVGAVASGRRDDAPVYQRVIICLAGPLPGLLAGSLLLGSAGALGNPYLEEAANMLLVINALNLLPVMPLDGGQIVHALLSSHFAVLSVIFSIAGSAALVLLALALGGHPVFVGIALLVLLASITRLRFSYCKIRLLKMLRREVRGAPCPDERSLLVRIFRALQKKPYASIPSRERAALVRYLRAQALVRPPGFLQTTALAALYTACLASIFLLPYLGMLYHVERNNGKLAALAAEGRFDECIGMGKRMQTYFALLSERGLHLDRTRLALGRCYSSKGAPQQAMRQFQRLLARLEDPGRRIADADRGAAAALREESVQVLSALYRRSGRWTELHELSMRYSRPDPA